MLIVLSSHLHSRHPFFRSVSTHGKDCVTVNSRLRVNTKETFTSGGLHFKIGDRVTHVTRNRVRRAPGAFQSQPSAVNQGLLSSLPSQSSIVPHLERLRSRQAKALFMRLSNVSSAALMFLIRSRVLSLIRIVTAFSILSPTLDILI